MAKDGDAVDTDKILRMALDHAAKPRSDGTSVLSDFADSAHAIQWMQVLAAPKVWAVMSRTPPREHLLRMVDTYLAYVRRGERNIDPDFVLVPYEQREPAALRLRALLETWSPPGLPVEIMAAARAVLYSDGMKGPPCGWDNLYDADLRPEEYLLWPENVAALGEARDQRRKRDGEGRS